MENVTVKIQSKQLYSTHTDVEEYIYTGQLAKKNENIYITYKDEEVNVTNIVKIKNGNVYVKRLGELKGNLEFDQNKPYQTMYCTPYGNMEMTVITQMLDINIHEKGIKIVIQYEITIGNEKASNNQYIISIMY